MNKLLLLLLTIPFLLPIQAQNSTKGKWTGPYDMDVVPVAAANLPDGRIITWSAKDKLAYGGGGGATYTSIFDPSDNSYTSVQVSNTDHDMFCPGINNLPDGRILSAGGSGNKRTSIYTPNENISDENNKWEIAAKMNTPRGYQGNVTTSEGWVFTLGGSWSGGTGNKNAEVWTEATGWIPFPNITSSATVLEGANDPQGEYRADNHGWFWPAPNGKIFHAGPSTEMHWIDLKNGGSVKDAGTRDDDAYAMNGTTVMYDIGKILKTGGAPSYSKDSLATKSTYIIDISNPNSDAVNVEKVQGMNYSRTFHNSVVLPNGEVLVIGGMKRSKIFSDDNARLPAEIWNPDTKTWRVVKSMTIPRTYHSTAILMPNGKVFAGGGGLCNDCDVNHPDAEVYSPPYLFKADNTLANRPVINSAPDNANYGQNITVNTNSAIDYFSMVRFSSVTHSTNNEQRWIPINSAKTGTNKYSLTMPNRNVAPPGYYMLFAINSNGTPSVAKVILVGNALPLNTNADNNRIQVNGTYTIKNKSNNQNLISPNWDNTNALMHSSANIYNTHKWVFKHIGDNKHTIQNVKSGRFLNANNGGCSNGVNVATSGSVNADNVRWYIEKNGNNYFLIPAHCQSKALDKQNGDSKSAHLWNKDAGNGNQQWDLLSITGSNNTINTNNRIQINGTLTIKNKSNNQNLISPNWDNTNALMHSSANIYNTHKWVFKHIGDNKHTIQNVKSGRFLNANNGGCSNGVNVATSGSVNADNVRWYIEKNGNNYFLIPAHCQSKALDKQNGDSKSAHLWNKDAGNGNQQWDLLPLNGARLDNFTSSEYSVFPNPVNNMLNIQIPIYLTEREDMELFVTIYNSNGMLVFDQKVTTKTVLNIDVKQLTSKQMYFVKLHASYHLDNDKISFPVLYTDKFIKQ